jgi:DNA-binding transcriptional LysR family regulator
MTPFDDLDLLRALVRIVESGSISAAARSLKIPQPSLSRHLRTLEERVGARLLQRDTHSLHLTEVGQRLLDSARTLLDLAEEATNRLREGQVALQGHLRLFSSIDIGQTAVTRLIARFLREHPKVTAELSYTNRPVQMIEEGYDVGIVAGHVTDERVVVRSATSLIRAVLGAPELIRSCPAPHAPGDLKSWPWAALSGRQFGGGSNAVTFVSPAGAVKTLRIEPVLLSEGVTSLREAVLSGLAIAVLPEWLVREDLESARLVKVLSTWTSRPIPLNVIHVADRQRPSRVEAFIAFAEANLPALVSRAEPVNEPARPQKSRK